MKINNIFSTLKNLQLSKDKLLLILLGGVLLVIISLPVKGKNEADNTADSRDTGEAIYYRRLMGRERLPSLSPSRIRERL